MVAVGGAATAVTMLRGDARGIWVTLGYFTVMEALQATGYAVIDSCGTPANRTITVLSYLHIAFQPLFINAFAMAIAPSEISARTRSWVWALAGLASVMLLARLAPIEALGRCAPVDVLCGIDWCLRSGEWHIAWEVPLNGGLAAFGIPGQFPAYVLSVFALPLLYGAWRFVVFHLAAGPVLATLLTGDPNEMPAIWCLFSIGIILISLSPFIRHRILGARMAVVAPS
jgi:hypothetical protein